MVRSKVYVQSERAAAMMIFGVSICQIIMLCVRCELISIKKARRTLPSTRHVVHSQTWDCGERVHDSVTRWVQGSVRVC